MSVSWNKFSLAASAGERLQRIIILQTVLNLKAVECYWCTAGQLRLSNYAGRDPTPQELTLP